MARIDPVCGMTVEERTAAGHTSHRGVTYYFCSTSCQQRFEADPGKYAARAPVTSAGDIAKQPAEAYTCPMHPEVRQAEPEVCSTYGMALEPNEAIAVEESPELADMTRRFRVSAALVLCPYS
ncbi:MULTISPECIES: YHS domain-containing protein [Pandoraea]|jgi:Cu+-exporting ATPase|uniref:YHS domain-containing protein n=3 Tax=Burkholderiaceae TaxID=119060 RepID=A0A5E5PA74_9BURK|nr:MULTISPECIES: YHS domain-containing protein [Pandoraea]MBN9096345.1 YHS domain-containing protein [Pandoraea pnomenusa]OXS88434.1 hypothetical protein B7H01_22020 [Pandoraea apista]PTD98388.1 YHS domain-containing protein [Pandoraea apista]RSC97894.1 YHS domain-containing protein [Pandoraea apista]RSD08729.1 YHS domain-containing protein [Pandoraea apista]